MHEFLGVDVLPQFKDQLGSLQLYVLELDVRAQVDAIVGTLIRPTCAPNPGTAEGLIPGPQRECEFDRGQSILHCVLVLDDLDFDLEQEGLTSFSAFRFLYERLLGPEARPYLPAVFCAAAALPMIRPAQRKVLLQSLSEAAATAPGWSSRAPTFYPERIEDVEAA